MGLFGASGGAVYLNGLPLSYILFDNNEFRQNAA
jgi:hypothetical protein